MCDLHIASCHYFCVNKNVFDLNFFITCMMKGVQNIDIVEMDIPKRM